MFNLIGINIMVMIVSIIVGWKLHKFHVLNMIEKELPEIDTWDNISEVIKIAKENKC